MTKAGKILDDLLERTYKTEAGENYLTGNGGMSNIYYKDCSSELKKAILKKFTLTAETIDKLESMKKDGTITMGIYKDTELEQLEEDTAIIITYRQGYNQALTDMKEALNESR